MSLWEGLVPRLVARTVRRAVDESSEFASVVSTVTVTAPLEFRLVALNGAGGCEQSVRSSNDGATMPNGGFSLLGCQVAQDWIWA